MRIFFFSDKGYLAKNALLGGFIQNWEMGILNWKKKWKRTIWNLFRTSFFGSLDQTDAFSIFVFLHIFVSKARKSTNYVL